VIKSQAPSTWLHGFLFLGLCFVILLFLWLPGLRLPITSDTSVYMRLGASLWHTGSYVLDGAPYAKHLPLHPLLSYPFVWLIGGQMGMKVSSLLAGMGVLAATFFLLKRPFGTTVASLAILFLALHHGFVLMTILGSADLLFTALFLGSLAAFQAADDRKKMYLLSGVFLGLACLTRYNGILLFGLYPLFILRKRPRDLKSAYLWGGACLALGLFGLWLVRNAIVFGNPLFTSYTSEFQAQTPSLLREVWRNFLYYLNPLHNILPVLLCFSLWGLWREGKRNALLVLGMMAGSAFALIWWVKGIRFAFPGYPILLGFATVAVLDLWQKRSRRMIFVFVAVLTLALHTGALCVYAYGQCNAWFDQTVGHIPSDLGLSSEGLFGISLARDYINSEAPYGSTVLVDSVNYWTWQSGVFRPDIRIVSSLKEQCPAFFIDQSVTSVGAALFQTKSAPITKVFLLQCPQS